MSTTSVRMSEDLMRRLNAAAERLHRSKGGIIEDAVREYLERDEERRRRLAETKDALAELDAGELVDGDAVLAWLDTWGTDHEREPPSP
jgi:predicted transcriptional regulator